MAKRRRRRRSRSSGSSELIALIVGVFIVLFVIKLAVEYWYIPLGLFAIAGGTVIFVRERGRANAARAEREASERWEANRQAWRALTFTPGSFSVIVSGFREQLAEQYVAEFLTDIPVLRDRPQEEVEALVERVVHIAPQTVAEGIAQRNAVHLKEALELRGANVKIKETPVRRSSNGREPIPEKVRNEVWRRDGGQCVDCGSREKLEYDHIIAVANGGSNTARNIELRCETCNRKKGAKV